MKKFLSFLLIITISFSIAILPVFAGSISVSECTSKILDLRKETAKASSIQSLVNSFASSPASGEEWYIMSIRNSHDDINYSKYREALKNYISTTEVKNATTREFNALVFLAVGGDTETIKNVVDDSAEMLGIMSRIYALHLLTNGAYSEKYTIDSIIDIILSMQLENGGWAITGKVADADATAMAIQALAPYYDTNSNVKNAIDTSLSILSSMQKDEGYYYSYGNPNPESAAQVLLALTSIGIDGLNDERFIKNGNTLLDGILLFKLEDGSFCHIQGGNFNQTTTNQVLYCLTSYNSFKNGGHTVYLLDELSEPEMPKEDDVKTEFKLNLKTVLYIAIAIVLIAWSVLLFVKGKKNIKNYLVVLIVCGLAASGVHFLKIQNPDDYYKEEKLDEYITCTLSIRCDTVAGQKDFIPKDGVILDFVSVKIPKDGTAYDQIVAAAKAYKLQLDHKSGYVSGISYIYEFDFGDLSGWMYRVNGEFASVGASEYKLKDNDYVEWFYTTNLGEDIGNSFSGE